MTRDELVEVVALKIRGKRTDIRIDTREIATDILAALEAAGADLGGWMPIDEKAKSGALVELAWPNWDYGVRVSRWLKSRNQWAWEGNKPYQLTVGEPSFYRLLPALPTPPKDKTNG